MPASALLTDLYELNMAASYLRRGMLQEATFSLFVRTLPPTRGFLVAAGLEPCLEFLETFDFPEHDLDYLEDVLNFPRDVVDFALRRTQGLEAAMTVARVSSIVGFSSTSNVEAARQFGLKVAGTMAHSYIESFPTEAESFRTFALDFPERTTFLVDTYDTLNGVRAAIAVIKELNLSDHLGIRIDSGDLGPLSRAAREILDDAGLHEVRIFVSGGLDEIELDRVVRSGAPIDAFGVGTRVGVSADAPPLDSAYKLVEYDTPPVMKLSSEKTTAPGRKQVFRGPDGDVVGLRDEPLPPGSEPLLVPVMKDGRRTGPHRTLETARSLFHADLERLPEPMKAVERPDQHVPRVSDALLQLTHDARSDALKRAAVL